jgi:hypothetical protein
MFLSAADKRHLAAALDKLPTELSYLRPGILSLAEQDQSLLGCGGGDPSAIDECLRHRTTDADFDIKSDAKKLTSWLKRSGDRDADWAAPLGFAVGYLHGYDEWALAEGNAPAPPVGRHISGLQKTTLPVPRGFKLKEYAGIATDNCGGAVELNNREVKIIIIEMDDEGWRIQNEAFQRYEEFRRASEQSIQPTPPILRCPPHLGDEPPTKVVLGTATGTVSKTIHKETGRTVTATYWLELPCARLEIGIVARKATGADLRNCEPILASIRCR